MQRNIIQIIDTNNINEKFDDLGVHKTNCAQIT